jgi:hypothetical protein
MVLMKVNRPMLSSAAKKNTSALPRVTPGESWKGPSFWRSASRWRSLASAAGISRPALRGWSSASSWSAREARAWRARSGTLSSTQGLCSCRPGHGSVAARLPSNSACQPITVDQPAARLELPHHAPELHLQLVGAHRDFLEEVLRHMHRADILDDVRILLEDLDVALDGVLVEPSARRRKLRPIIHQERVLFSSTGVCAL